MMAILHLPKKTNVVSEWVFPWVWDGFEFILVMIAIVRFDILKHGE